MKVWLGVIGRACVEFVIILLLASFAAGAGRSVALTTVGMRAIYESAATAALGLAPLAALLTLFLAFFSFEFRLRSRIAGWLGLLLLGALLFCFGLGIRFLPFLHDAAAQIGTETQSLRLIPAGTAVQQGRSALYIRAFEGGGATDAAAVDFSSDFPRLSYSPRAEVDPASGETEVQGRLYQAAYALPQPQALVPEAALFSGAWIWDRLAGQEKLPLALAMSGGFLLLALGFRFLCRITGWPLANALLAAAGLAGLVILDAALSGSQLMPALEALLARLGPFFKAHLHGPLLLALVEALLGLILGAADLATAPRGGSFAHG
jgi:hypothetical protein